MTLKRGPGIGPRYFTFLLYGSVTISVGAAAAGVTCGAKPPDNEGVTFTATPYCETVITESPFMTNDLAYRSVGSIAQADLEVPDTFTFTTIGSGAGTTPHQLVLCILPSTVTFTGCGNDST